MTEQESFMKVSLSVHGRGGYQGELQLTMHCYPRDGAPFYLYLHKLNPVTYQHKLFVTWITQIIPYLGNFSEEELFQFSTVQDYGTPLENIIAVQRFGMKYFDALFNPNVQRKNGVVELDADGKLLSKGWSTGWNFEDFVHDK